MPGGAPPDIFRTFDPNTIDLVVKVMEYVQEEWPWGMSLLNMLGSASLSIYKRPHIRLHILHSKRLERGRVATCHVE